MNITHTHRERGKLSIKKIERVRVVRVMRRGWVFSSN